MNVVNLLLCPVKMISMILRTGSNPSYVDLTCHLKYFILKRIKMNYKVVSENKTILLTSKSEILLLTIVVETFIFLRKLRGCEPYQGFGKRIPYTREYVGEYFETESIYIFGLV